MKHKEIFSTLTTSTCETLENILNADSINLTSVEENVVEHAFWI